jgi:tripartite-type tricarboxylate transporter receptor subunit TctC
VRSFSISLFQRALRLYVAECSEPLNCANEGNPMSIATRMLAIATGLLLSFCATAQSYPSKPVTIVSSAAAGGPVEFLARLLSERLPPRLGQQVIIDIRPGAGGYIGSEYVARAAPDGYTLLIQTPAGMTHHLFVKNQPVVIPRALVPVAGLGGAANVFSTTAQLPVKDLRELMAHVKANPGKLNVAVFLNSGNYLQIRHFLKSNGLEMTEVSYAATTAVMTALVRGDAHLYLSLAAAPRAQIEAGTVKALAIADSNRSEMLPSVPTTKELGINYESGIYYALMAPVNTPAAVIRKLNEEVSAVMKEPAMRESLRKVGMVPYIRSPEALAADFNAEMGLLERTAKEAGIQPQ